ncbi:MAG: HEAT repeat domain-containing protein [Gemmatimonadota bacterium]
MNPHATFVKRFGDLVALLRTDPGNDAAQELALTAAAAAVDRHPVVVESGVERGLVLGEDLTLEGRLRARRIDAIRVSPGAAPEELLSLARALSHDRTGLTSTPRIRVELAPEVRPEEPAADSDFFTPPRLTEERRRWQERRRWRAERWRGPERRRVSDRRSTGERRTRLAKHHQAAAARLKERLARAVSGGAWTDALETAHALLESAPRIPAPERRMFALGVRKQLPRRALGGLIDVALHDPAERERAVEVLCWTGLEGADAMVDAVRASEGVGGRRFLHDALGTMPEAFPAVAPLLRSPEPHEVRHAAAILGRMGRPEAVGPLKEHLAHGDAGVREAILHALAEFPLRDVADALRSGLAHPSPATRAAAAEAIAGTRAPALAMPLVAALDAEPDGRAWSAMVRALAALPSPEACAGLVSLALARRRLLGGGHSTERRVEAVRVLATVTAPCRTGALERIACEGDEPVRHAAAAALAGQRSEK